MCRLDWPERSFGCRPDNAAFVLLHLRLSCAAAAIYGCPRGQHSHTLD